ncbi:hypothetical protein ACIP1G_11195 [Pseudomonas sp. NPDC089392]|uniref:hypothetical protein n=1 Tax=Pseudomonas sp. NPDC089392 TaxID=3364459 RepID=UPI0038245E55
MTNYQFNLILALLFMIAGNGAETPGLTAVGYTIGIACGLVSLVYAFLERKS